MTTKNARFWVYVNGDFAKLTLRPGQELEHVEGGPTDEGFSYCANRWTHEGDGVSNSVDIWARDCDGRFETQGDYFCELSQLNTGNTNLEGDIQYPAWEKGHSSQRDYSAETMGY